MSEAIQVNNYETAPGIPLKRKRGRPRKDKTLGRMENVRRRKAQNFNRAENASMPTGFHGVNGNHPYHVNSVVGSIDGMVGQAVSGVVEAEFDAGYLLAVRIGNSNITLRGVVFKPGHCAPVTAENDVAPRVQMIRRNEIHLPTQKQARGRGLRRSRERHEQHIGYIGNGSPSNESHRVAPPMANLVSSKGKSAAIVAAPSVPPVGARGTVVPVVLEPVSSPIGQPPYQMSSAASQAAHMAALKGKHVETVTPLAVYDPRGSTPPQQMLAVTSGLLSSQPQTSSHVAPSVNNHGGISGPRAMEFRHDVGKSMNSNDAILQGDVIGGAQSSGNHNNNILESAGKFPAEDSGAVVEQENSDINEPLYVEPLRTIHTNFHNQSPYVPRLVGQNGVGRMTELLQSVQKDTQLHAEHLAGYTPVELHEQRIPESG